MRFNLGVVCGAVLVAGGSIARSLMLRRKDPKEKERRRRELISIDGYYRTAEEMDASLRNRPAQCWLQDSVLSIAALD